MYVKFNLRKICPFEMREKRSRPSIIIDVLAILEKSLDRALFLYIFIPRVVGK